MRTVLRFLFPAKSCSAKASGILLASRMIFGGLLFSHGIAKWSNFDTMSTMFPDPLGIGSSASLSLAIFGEVICSLGFIVGAFYRLALIPMIFTMCIAFFVIHGQIRLRWKSWHWFIWRFSSWCILRVPEIIRWTVWSLKKSAAGNSGRIGAMMPNFYH